MEVLPILGGKIESNLVHIPPNPLSIRQAAPKTTTYCSFEQDLSPRAVSRYIFCIEIYLQKNIAKLTLLYSEMYAGYTGDKG
jgi:hypothetical protein